MGEWDWRQALHVWRVVTLAGVRGDEPDLTARQLAVLTTVYLTDAPHTVRGLAEELGVGKPAITRALDTLCRHRYVRRRRDPADGRNVLVQRTAAGSVYLRDLAERIHRVATDLPAQGEAALG